MLTDFISLLLFLQENQIKFNSKEIEPFVGDWSQYFDIKSRMRLQSLEQQFSQFDRTFWKENLKGRNLKFAEIRPHPLEGRQILKNYALSVMNHAVPAVFIGDLVVNLSIPVGSGSYCEVYDVTQWKERYFDLEKRTPIPPTISPNHILKYLNSSGESKKEPTTKELELGLELYGTPNIEGFIAAVITGEKDEEEFEEEDSLMQENINISPENRFIYKSAVSNNPLLGFLGNKADFGTLEDFLQDENNFDWEDSDGFLFQLTTLLKGIITLHDKFHLTHRDIKSDNILVFKDQDPDCYQLKLADFGIADKWGYLKAWKEQQNPKPFYPLEHFKENLSQHLNGPNSDLFQFGLLLKRIAGIFWKTYRASWAFKIFGPLILSLAVHDPRNGRLDENSVWAYLTMLDNLNVLEKRSKSVMNVTLELPPGNNSIEVFTNFEASWSIHPQLKIVNIFWPVNLHRPWKGTIALKSKGALSEHYSETLLETGAISS